MRLHIGRFTLDSERRQLLMGSREIHLQPKAFRLLCALIEARPNALSKDKLLEALWPGAFVTEGNLTVLINEIRDALGDEPRTPRFIRTHQRYGYAFIAEAVEVSPACAVRRVTSDHWLLLDRHWVELPPGEVVVGSDPRCQVRLDLPGIAPQHARLTVDEGGVTLEDLGSDEGTSKRGKPVTSGVALKDGDQLRFGSVAALYRRWPDLVSILRES